MSWFYPNERKLTKDDVESYAHALYHVLLELEIFDGHCKMYDPLTIDEDAKIAHSYVFDLEGGRHHPYASLEALKNDLLEETIDLIKNDYEPNLNHHLRVDD